MVVLENFNHIPRGSHNLMWRHVPHIDVHMDGPNICKDGRAWSVVPLSLFVEHS